MGTQVNYLKATMQVLLIIKDKRLTEDLSFTLSSKFYAEVLTATSVKEGVEELKKTEYFTDLIIVEDQRELFNLYSYLRKAKLSSPSIIVTDDESKNIGTSNTENIIGYALRKKLVDDVYLLINANFDLSDLQTEDLFCPIPTKLIERVSPLKGDLFIRIGEDKFVRLFSRNDKCTNDDVEKYAKKKKVSHLYLRRGDTDLFLAKIHDDIDNLLSNGNYDSALLDDVALDSVDLIQNYVKRFGFTEEVVVLAEKSVKVMELAISESPKLNGIFEKFNNHKDRYLPVHSIVIAHIASAIAIELQWNTKGTLYKLCMAAMLHDITLENDDLAMIASLDELHEKMEQFTPEEVAAYKNHVTHCAQLVDKFRDVPSDVANIIVQHHERPDGSGFPRGLTAAHISPLSSVFIVAHEIVRKLLLNKTTFSMEEEFLNLVKHLDHGSTFHEIINALDPYNPEISKKMYG